MRQRSHPYHARGYPYPLVMRHVSAFGFFPQASRLCQASALPKTTTECSSNPQQTILSPPAYPARDLGEVSDPAGEWGRRRIVGQDLPAASEGILNGVQDLPAAAEGIQNGMYKDGEAVDVGRGDGGGVSADFEAQALDDLECDEELTYEGGTQSAVDLEEVSETEQVRKKMEGHRLSERFLVPASVSFRAEGAGVIPP